MTSRCQYFKRYLWLGSAVKEVFFLSLYCVISFHLKMNSIRFIFCPELKLIWDKTFKRNECNFWLFISVISCFFSSCHCWLQTHNLRADKRTLTWNLLCFVDLKGAAGHCCSCNKISKNESAFTGIKGIWKMENEPYGRPLHCVFVSVRFFLSNLYP